MKIFPQLPGVAVPDGVEFTNAKLAEAVRKTSERGRAERGNEHATTCLDYNIA